MNLDSCRRLAASAGAEGLRLAYLSWFLFLSTASVQLKAVTCDPPPSGIVGWWGAESNALDYVAGNNGTLMNGAGFTNGEVGTAFNLNGVNQFVLVNPSAPTNLDVGQGSGFTIEGWIKPASISSTMMIVQYERVLGGSGSDVGVQLDVDGIPGSGIFPGCLGVNVVDTGGGGHVFGSPAGVLTNGVWQHIALAYDKTSGNAVFYTNGVAVAQANLGTFTPQTSFTNILFGATTDYGSVGAPGNVYSGQIDELSLYNRALSSNEIAGIFQAGNGGKCTGPIPPVITYSPASQTNVVLNTATFTVQAIGTAPLFYQWRFDGTNLMSATNSVLTLPNLATNQAGNYDVIVSNYVGSVTSSPAMLTVLFIGIELNGALVTTSTVTAFSPATITILGGYSGGYIFYTLDGSAPTISSTLYTGPFVLTNSAVINAAAVSGDFSQQSTNAPVTVQIVPTYTLQTSIVGSGTLSTNPPGGVYASNTVVTLTATPSAHWSFAGWGGDTNGTQNPLSVTMNGPRNIQATFVQTAYPLTLTTPGGGTVFANGVIIGASTYYPTDSVVSLTATPTGGFSFIGWQGSINSTNNPYSLVITQTNVIQGIFGAYATTNPLSGGNPVGGNIILSFTNPVPYGTSLAASAVPNPGNYFGGWSGVLSGTTTPGRVTVTTTNLGFGAYFYTLPAGKFSLSAVVNGNGFVTVNGQKSYYNSNDTVQLIETPNAGAYFFGWTGSATGALNFLTLQVTNNDIIQANFGVGPSVGIAPPSQTVFARSNATLNASALGYGPLTYQWQNTNGAIFKATNSVLVITNIQPAGAGNYWVVVSNSLGMATSGVALVTVIGGPSITNPPTPVSVIVGHPASFTVGAFGAPTLAYQWQFNGARLGGATNTLLTISNAFPGSAGLYTVAVTNTWGSVTSSPASLTVLPLTIAVPAKLVGGQFQITFDTATGINYEVDYSTNLPQWTPWLTLGGTGQPMTLKDPSIGANPNRFYRIVLSSQ